MNIERLATALVAIAGVILQGCATPNGPKPATRSLAVARVEGPPIYVLLQQTPAGYRLTQLAARPLTASEAWLDLRDLTPAFVTADEHGCTTGRTIDREQSMSNPNRCKTLVPELFRTDSMSAGEIAVKGVATLATLGTLGTYRVTDVHFDASAFQQARDEAAARMLVPRADLVVAAARVINAQEIEARRYAAQASNMRATFDVRDASGLYREGDIAFPAVAVAQSQSGLPEPLVKDLERLDAQAVTARFDAIDAQLRQARSMYVVNCPTMNNVNGFWTNWDCPRSVARPSVDGVVTFPVVVRLSSRHFHNIRPRIFEMRDSRVVVTAGSDAITVDNLTDQYVTVSSVTVYYQGEAFTISGAPAPQLAPHTQAIVGALSEFQRGLPTFDMPNATATQIAHDSVHFGLAIQYQVDGRTASLHRAEDFPLRSIAMGN